MSTVRCDYIGCHDPVAQPNDLYCARHARIGQKLSQGPPIHSAALLNHLQAELPPRDQALMSHLLRHGPTEDWADFAPDEWRASIVEEEAQPPVLDDSPPVLDNDSLFDSKSQCNTRDASKTRTARLVHTQRQTQTQKQSRTHQRLRQKIKRTIREKGGEKVTEEQEETEKESERVETLVQFATEQQVDVYATETTERYEARINAYAQNKELVHSVLVKWYEALNQERLQDRLDTSLSLVNLITHPGWDLFQKQSIMSLQLWSALWSEHNPQPLPVLQKIVYYTVEDFPDGRRKAFHCQFASHKLATESLVVVLPEIFLRAFPPYADVIRAFFITKFLPFRRMFMKHRWHQERMQHRGGVDAEKALNQFLEEEENGGFRQAAWPEINPCVCLVTQRGE